jgi:hypothetical protein
MKAEQAAACARYVEVGGNLIVFRPSKTILNVLDVKYNGEALSPGYVELSGEDEVTAGLLSRPLQLHTAADRYDAKSMESVATTIGGADREDRSSAILLGKHGKGQFMVFAYNLPESIVYTRQGNPASAGFERDGILGIRAMDLFTHGFVDTTNNTINQADEQMRLLTRGIEHLTAQKKPMPRFWYFPDSLKCMVTLNNDGEDSKEAEFLKQFNDVERAGGRMTLYVKEPEFISKTQIDDWTRRGFEISGHPDDTKQAVKPDWKTMDSVYTNLQGRLEERFGIGSMKTITNHWFVWVGNNADGKQNLAAQAQLEEQHGIGLDCNYAHYDNGSDQGHFLGAMGLRQGNYTGSGLSMKFANGDGRILNIYQQLNNVYDQQYMEHKDQEGYFNAFKGIMDRSLHDEVYSTICVRAHNNEYFFSEIPLMKMLTYAKSNNIPVWSELTWLQFLQAKDEASFQNIRWTGTQLSFDVHSALPFGRDLSVLVPYRFEGRMVNQVLSGDRSGYEVITIKGREYARVYCSAGENTAVKVMYGN